MIKLAATVKMKKKKLYIFKVLNTVALNIVKKFYDSLFDTREIPKKFFRLPKNKYLIFIIRFIKTDEESVVVLLER